MDSRTEVTVSVSSRKHDFTQATYVRKKGEKRDLWRWSEGPSAQDIANESKVFL